MAIFLNTYSMYLVVVIMCSLVYTNFQEDADTDLDLLGAAVTAIGDDINTDVTDQDAAEFINEPEIEILEPSSKY